MIWNCDPELFNLFGLFSIRYYGLCFVIGFALGFAWVYRQHRKEGLSTSHLESLLIHIAVGAMAGARIGHCLFYEPEYFLSNPIEMFLPIAIGPEGIQFVGFQGLASHGGAIGLLIGLLIFGWKTKRPLLPIFDKLAVAIPLTGAFIRLGNFMNSEILGTPTDGPFAVIFARVNMIPRHPAQLYEAVVYLLLFFVLWFVYVRVAEKGPVEKSNKNSGFVFGLFLVLLFSSRFFLEFFKIDQVDFEAGMVLNMGQWLSLPFVLVGALFMMRERRVADVDEIKV